MALADPQLNFSENKLFVQKKKTCPDFLGSNPLPRCSSCLCSRQLAHPAAEAPTGWLLRELRSDSLLRRGMQRARSIPGASPARPIPYNEHPLPHNSTQCLPVGMRRDVCTQRGCSLAEQVLLVSAAHRQDAKLGLGCTGML